MVFFGRETVQADLDLHKDMAGGVTTGTLAPLGRSAVPYANVCLWPGSERTAIDEGGMPVETCQLTAWRMGEADPSPRPDDAWSVNGVSYLIVSVGKRHFADEASGYCIYDCQVSRTGPR